jgi:hypothetical protein
MRHRRRYSDGGTPTVALKRRANAERNIATPDASSPTIQRWPTSPCIRVRAPLIPLIRERADPPGRAGAVFRYVSAKRLDEHDVVEALRHKRCAHIGVPNSRSSIARVSHSTAAYGCSARIRMNRSVRRSRVGRCCPRKQTAAKHRGLAAAEPNDPRSRSLEQLRSVSLGSRHVGAADILSENAAGVATSTLGGPFPILGAAHGSRNRMMPSASLSRKPLVFEFASRFFERQRTKARWVDASAPRGAAFRLES